MTRFLSARREFLNQVTRPQLTYISARATSAAPSYFPAKFIRGLGFTQDGGASRHNNPVDPAEWEARAIWNATSDIVVSIGTGYTQIPPPSPVIPHRLRLRDRFLLRLFRIFGAMIDAQSSWLEHINRQTEEDRNKYYRVNMLLDQAPELDECDEIPRMKRSSSLFLEQFDFRPVVQALLSASFFLELQGMPASEVGRTKLRCFGTIRCRSPESHALIHRILDDYPAAYFSLDQGKHLGVLSSQDLCRSCGKFNKDVTFTIRDMERSLIIYLQLNTSWKCKISGFPQSVWSLAKKQSLEADFGRSDHGTLRGGGCCSFPGKKRSLPASSLSRKRIRMQ
jgi:hypothetical protein